MDKQNKNNKYIDGNQINHLFKINNIQLTGLFSQLKDKIDEQFNKFKNNLIIGLNNINYIRYIQANPQDDFKFIFKEQVHASNSEQKLNQKNQILQKMYKFSVLNDVNSGISGNCIYQINKLLENKHDILNFKQLCPSGQTFLQRYQKIFSQYMSLWKNSKNQLNFENIFPDFSSAFPKQQMKKIGSIFGQSKLSILSSKLIYRASDHSFQSSVFKQLCAGRGDTLLIAKSDRNKIFGAYTPCKWMNTKQKQFVSDPSASSFLFSLDKKLIFPIKKNQLDYAISAYGGWGPIYGSPYGPDLSISDKCNLNDHSCSSLGSHYQIPIQIKEYSNQAFSLLAGSKKFKVLQYQIYELILK